MPNRALFRSRFGWVCFSRERGEALPKLGVELSTNIRRPVHCTTRDSFEIVVKVLSMRSFNRGNSENVSKIVVKHQDNASFDVVQPPGRRSVKTTFSVKIVVSKSRNNYCTCTYLSIYTIKCKRYFFSAYVIFSLFLKLRNDDLCHCYEISKVVLIRVKFYKYYTHNTYLPRFRYTYIIC